MYDYSCEEFPFFKVNPQSYPSKTQQVSTKCLNTAQSVQGCSGSRSVLDKDCLNFSPPAKFSRIILFQILYHKWSDSCLLSFPSVQLHFIENYLRASDPGFDNLYTGDQLKMKESLYVEVNR